MRALKIEREGAVVRLTLNRPEVRNAFDDALIAELTEAFVSIDARAVVLAGEGKSFCAGGDLEWMRRSIDLSTEENVRDARLLANMFHAIDSCPCPVIARVHGAAFGGGVGLVCAADIVVAEDGTKFCFSEVKLGLAPAVINPFAVRKIGISAARRYFLTAEVFDAAEAHRVGLVHEVAAPGEVDQKVNSILDAVLSAGPKAVVEAKRLIAASGRVSHEELEQSCVNAIARLRTSPEGQEGVRAFLEKRKPEWGDL